MIKGKGIPLNTIWESEFTLLSLRKFQVHCIIRSKLHLKVLDYLCIVSLKTCKTYFKRDLHWAGFVGAISCT